MLTRPLSLMSAAAMACLLTACSSGSTTKTADGANIIKDGVLSVCSVSDYAPFEARQGDKIVGFDISMMDLVAQKLHLTVNVVNTPFEGIQSGQALNTGKCDIAAASMTITPERQKAIDFSDPYFDASQGMLVKKGSGYDSLASLAGKTIAVQEGTTGQIYVQKNAPKSLKVRVFEDLGLMTTAVKTGQVQATVSDIGAVQPYAKNNPTTEVSAIFDTKEAYGFAVKKNGNDKLLSVTNNVIAAAKSDGTYDEIYKKWFGIAPPTK